MKMRYLNRPIFIGQRPNEFNNYLMKAGISEILRVACVELKPLMKRRYVNNVINKSIFIGQGTNEGRNYLMIARITEILRVTSVDLMA